MRSLLALALAACSFSGAEGVVAIDAVPGDGGPDTPPPPTTFKAISGGYGHTCAIDMADSLWCWGDNVGGQLGVPGIVEATTRVQVGSARWRVVSAGVLHTCGIQMDDTLWCWGNNANGRAGADENLAPVLFEPRQIAGAWTHVAGGVAHTCAIAMDGRLGCWGAGDDGALGGGTTNGSIEPVFQSGTWTAVTAGEDASCGIRDGEILCWGRNKEGQVGIGSSQDAVLGPMVVSGGPNWRAVSMAVRTTCALDATERIWCWGANAHGQIGDGTAIAKTSPAMVAMAGNGTWAEVQTGAFHTCGRQGGEVYCWGSNYYESSGSNGMPYTVLVPENVSTALGPVRQLGQRNGFYHTCVITEEGAPVCVGFGAYGGLGNGFGGVRPRPVRIAGQWGRVWTGGRNTCAASAIDNVVHCWGENGRGQFGRGDLAPAQAPRDLGVAPLDLGLGTSVLCTISPNGNGVECSGSNANRLLGHSGPDSSFPMPVEGGVAAKAIAIRRHACAIPPSLGGLYCWGDNERGEGFTGGVSNELAPAWVQTNRTFDSIAVGNGFTCATEATGGLVCVGRNNYGQLAGGSTTDSTQGIAVPGMFSRVVAGADHACALDKLNQLFCWGRNQVGQVGVGNENNVLAPQQVTTGTWAKLTAGDNHTCAIDTDGALWCWGLNNRGMLGDGTTTNHSVPMRVGTDSDWIEIAAGVAHTCGIRTPDQLYCWGDPGLGTIGDNGAWRETWEVVP